MPELIGGPSRVAAAGEPPKLIDEYVGGVNTGEARLSIVTRTRAGWELGAGRPAGPAACEASTTADGAIKLYTRDPAAPPLSWRGDPELASALS